MPPLGCETPGIYRMMSQEQSKTCASFHSQTLTRSKLKSFLKLDDLAGVLGVCKDTGYRSLVDTPTGTRGFGIPRFLPP